MSPRTGRPQKEDAKKVKLTLRLNEATAAKLKKCAERLNMTRTEVIEKGIDLMNGQQK